MSRENDVLNGRLAEARRIKEHWPALRHRIMASTDSANAIEVLIIWGVASILGWQVHPLFVIAWLLTSWACHRAAAIALVMGLTRKWWWLV